MKQNFRMKIPGSEIFMDGGRQRPFFSKYEFCVTAIKTQNARTQGGTQMMI
jgi:hypothetical protein